MIVGLLEKRKPLSGLNISSPGECRVHNVTHLLSPGVIVTGQARRQNVENVRAECGKQDDCNVTDIIDC